MAEENVCVCVFECMCTFTKSCIIHNTQRESWRIGTYYFVTYFEENFFLSLKIFIYSVKTSLYKIEPGGHLEINM